MYVCCVPPSPSRHCFRCHASPCRRSISPATFAACFSCTILQLNEERHLALERHSRELLAHGGGDAIGRYRKVAITQLLSEFSRSGVPFPHRRGDRRRSCPEFVFKPATKNVKPGHYAVSYSRSCSDFALLATLICYFYKIFSSAARQRRHKPTPLSVLKEKKSLSARGRRPGQSPHRPWNSSQQVRSSRETTKRNRLLHFVKR